jgi:hypothetical protein
VATTPLNEYDAVTGTLLCAATSTATICVVTVDCPYERWLDTDRAASPSCSGWDQYRRRTSRR